MSLDVWTLGRATGRDKRIRRCNDPATARRLARSRKGYVTDSDRADRVIYVSKGFRRRAGMNGAGPGGPSLQRLEHHQLERGRRGDGRQFGARVQPWWLRPAAEDQYPDDDGDDGEWVEEW